MNQIVGFTVLLLILLIRKSVDGLQCASCQDVADEALCTTTQTCTQGQSCYKMKYEANNTIVTTEGCLDNSQCGVDVSSIIGRDTSKFAARQSPTCKECCSTDNCNTGLCQHLKPSVCLDDETLDCPKMNSLFNICSDIPHAKRVCPRFCNLCNVVDGQWSTWSDWTKCAVACDNGTVSRQRSCSNPAPSSGGLNCTGAAKEVKECLTATPCPVDGNWSEWGQWGSCSTSCEAGIKTRARTCTNPKPDNQGDHCFGPNVEAQLCDNGPCTDGGWSAWSAWSNCSSKCRTGIRTQSRTCTNPKPSPHGKYCVGNSFRVDTCIVTSCPYADCSEIKENEPDVQDGIFYVSLWQTHNRIRVYCDMTTDGGGWTVFQRRYNSAVDFYRKFNDYVNGFGDLHTDFWLGLEYIQELASKNTNQLRIDLTASNGDTAFEVFDNFFLSTGPDYTLHVGNTSSSHNIGSTHRFAPEHNNMAFSTYDHDADKDNSNCATYYRGGWWYNGCHEANLNGEYLTPGSSGDTGIRYNSFRYHSSLLKTMMSFRRART